MASKISTSFDVGFAPASFDEMLVELHDAQRNYAVSGHERNSVARQRVVHSVAEILKNDISDVERDQIADIILSLLRQAERDLRESLSERICVMDGVPEDVVLYLAHDIITVAKPVLKHSPILTQQDLLYIIQSKGREYWQAIAERKLLDSAVVDALVERGDETTALNLLLNERISLKVTAIEAFAELSKYSENIAEPLLRRPELPQRIAMDLYWHVSALLRARIVENYDIPKEKLDAALQDALEDFSETSVGVQDPKPSALMIELAAQYGRQDRINDQMLVKTLRRGQIRFFVALMAERSGLSPHTIHEIMRQIGGQGMAVACKAMGVVKENFISLFLLARSLTRGDQAVDALELRKAIKYFDALNQDLATTILADSIIKG